MICRICQAPVVGRRVYCSPGCSIEGRRRYDAARYAAMPDYYKEKAKRSAAKPHNRKRKNEQQNAKRRGLLPPKLPKEPITQLDPDERKRRVAEIMRRRGFE